MGEDEKRLAELGYKQELNRNWSGFSNFAISFSIISILAGCFNTFGQAWNNGGPIAISLGWPLISAFILVIGLCLSELVSAYPTSGGIYWWASTLGGPKAGYYTGWLNLIGLWAVIASVSYGCATFLDYTLSAFNPTYATGYSLQRVFLLFVLVLGALWEIVKQVFRLDQSRVGGDAVALREEQDISRDQVVGEHLALGAFAAHADALR
jgi:amino acid transporter